MIGLHALSPSFPTGLNPSAEYFIRVTSFERQGMGLIYTYMLYPEDQRTYVRDRHLIRHNIGPFTYHRQHRYTPSLPNALEDGIRTRGYYRRKIIGASLMRGTSEARF